MQKSNESVVNINDITRISSGTSIKGDIISSADIRVDGTIDGIVYSEGRIVVGEKATMSGAVLCTNVDMWGKMEGNLHVKDTLSIKSTAAINGNINVRRIQVEIGAMINGGCQMISEQDFDKAVASTVAIKKAAPAKKEEAAAKV